MSSPSCLEDELLLITCLNDNKLNFDESIAHMLAVDNADKGVKDEKDNDIDNDNNDKRLLLSSMVPNSMWWTDSPRGTSRAGLVVVVFVC